MATHEAKTVKVTLLRRRVGKQVLYLEARKDFVDILMSFLTLPTGAIIKILSTGHAPMKSLGAIVNVFRSVEKLEESSLYVPKSILLDPKPATGFSSNVLRIDSASTPTHEVKYYGCSSGRYTSACSVVATDPSMMCSQCRNPMTRGMMLITKEAETNKIAAPTAVSLKGGYVKKSMSYIITDDLEITPSSTITTIVLLNKLKVERMAELESCEALVGLSEVVQLLKASLTTSSALNEVFGKI